MQSSLAFRGHVLQAYDGLLSNITRPSYIPIYRDFKDLLCCNLTHRTDLVWVSWTVAATASGAKALMQAAACLYQADTRRTA